MLKFERFGWFTATLVLLSAAIGCDGSNSDGGDSGSTVTDAGDRDARADEGSRADASEADAAEPELDGGQHADASTGEGDSLFALVTMIFGDNGDATTYVALLDALEDQQVSLESAVEFPGWASIAAFDDGLLVANGEAPEITRYEIEAGELVAGDTVSFANFGVDSVSFFHNLFFDSSTAHLRLEETARILWNPSELSIEGSVEAPQIMRERDGLAISASNAEGIAVREDGAFWPYFWHDVDWYEFHQHSQIGIYQPDGSVELLDVPCPALNVVTRDEDDNLYFSGMVDTLGHAYAEPQNAVERCVARIDAGEQTIAEGWPRSFDELVGGRPAGRFQYMRDGKGLLLVFHEERATIDPEDTASIFTDHWALWLVDLESWSAERIEDWGYGSSNVFISRVGGRTFLHDVAADFSEAVISEVDVDGTVTERIRAPGYAAVLVQVR